MRRIGLTGCLLASFVGSAGMARASDLTPITPVVDANASGQAAIAWTTPTAVRVATSDRSGASAATTTLATTTAASPAVAVDDAGEVVVVWETYRVTKGFPCHGCGGASLASDGVFAAVGRVGAGFGAPVRLTGPLPDPPSGTGDQLTRPLLAMDPQGRAIVAGSDGANAWVASRAPGGAFDAPQRAAPDFVVTGAAFGRDGEVLLTDLRSRVITRPAGGAFSAPVPLPGASTPYGPGAAIAASSAGDAVALYRGGPGLPVLASRRAADGSFAAPTTLTQVNGASGRAVTVAADGTAVAVFGQIDRDPREGGHSALIAATLRPDGTSTTTQINAPDTDGDILRGGLDGDDAGHVAFAYTQSSAALFPGKAFVTLQQADGSRLGPVMLGSAPFGLGDLAKVAVSGATVLATWTDHTGGTVHLFSRWLPGGETVTLDHTPDPYAGLAKLFGLLCCFRGSGAG